MEGLVKKVLMAVVFLLPLSSVHATTFEIDAWFKDATDDSIVTGVTGFFEFDGAEVVSIDIEVSGAETSSFDTYDLIGANDGFDAVDLSSDILVSIFTAELLDTATIGVPILITDASFIEGPSGFPVYIFDAGTVTAVPLPAAAWLFISALGALGWAKRRQATA